MGRSICHAREVKAGHVARPPGTTVGGIFMRHVPRHSRCWLLVVLTILTELACSASCAAAVTREEVERAIREGVRYLKGLQRDDGSWADVEADARTGVTSLVTLALLTAG